MYVKPLALRDKACRIDTCHPVSSLQTIGRILSRHGNTSFVNVVRDSSVLSLVCIKPLYRIVSVTSFVDAHPGLNAPAKVRCTDYDCISDCLKGGAKTMRGDTHAATEPHDCTYILGSPETEQVHVYESRSS
jgi:hypothetical protein